MTEQQLPESTLPQEVDYVGVYITNKCFLSCDYCITNSNGKKFINNENHKELTPDEWINGLNRLKLPKGVPITLQGGEPFLYNGIWEILSNILHKIDILTALPASVTEEKFLKLPSLSWNRRKSPYPTIRVSYHRGQNNYKQLIEKIARLQKIVNIGLYHIEHPAYPEETKEIKTTAKKHKIEFRTKEFLGRWNGRLYGTYRYADAVRGDITHPLVRCKSTVLPIASDGYIYRCHSDLYYNRHNLALGNILDAHLKIEHKYRACHSYGLCSECDIKIKTDHNQEYGYTSCDIKFEQQ